MLRVISFASCILVRDALVLYHVCSAATAVRSDAICVLISSSHSVLACIVSGDPNPVVFLEPKSMYRSAVADVPTEDYTTELSKADIMRTGSDITIVGWGAQLRVLEKVLYADTLFASNYDAIAFEMRAMDSWHRLLVP